MEGWPTALIALWRVIERRIARLRIANGIDPWLKLSPGVMIVVNDVSALLLDNNSAAELDRPLQPLGHNDGMIVEHQSVAQFLADVKLENNGQNDLDCDQSSLFHGDSTDGGKNDRFSRTPKSPMPWTQIA